MNISMLKGKIHRATVVQAELEHFRMGHGRRNTM